MQVVLAASIISKSGKRKLSTAQLFSSYFWVLILRVGFCSCISLYHVKDLVANSRLISVLLLSRIACFL